MKRGIDFNNLNYGSRKGQVAIFIIIAIVIVALVALFFVFKGRISVSDINPELKPVYDYYISCVEASVESGVKISSSQGGYIELPRFEPGSEHAPFSNQLDFFGFSVPYWYYVSSSSLIVEQVPSELEINKQLEDFIDEEVRLCDFGSFRAQGFSITLNEANSNIKVEESEITVNLDQDIIISRENEDGDEVKEVIKNHNIVVKSKFGKQVKIAKEIYEYEKKEKFLENYARDVMFLYAPVSGAEVTCKPLTWNPYEVIDNLTLGLESNIDKIKLDGSYYKLDEKEDEYYVVEAGIDLRGERINFLYDKSWPSRFEVWPTKGELMIANPVSPAEAGSILGFCYASYKFVYDLYFPIMVQVFDNDGEIFQFPISVIVDKNEVVKSEILDQFEEESEICENTNSEITIYTYDNNLNGVEAEVSFDCLASTCRLGETEIDETGEAKLIAKVPACVNGEVITNAEGYGEKRYRISTNEERVADVIMDEEFNLEVEVYVDNVLIQDSAILYFESESDLDTVVYPEQKEVILNEGQYTIDAVIMKEGSITFPSRTVTECTSVSDGVFGIFGFEKEKCFEINIPGQEVKDVIYSGGGTEYFAVESELDRSKVIKVYADSFPIPSDIEQLSKNYEMLDGGNIDVFLE